MFAHCMIFAFSLNFLKMHKYSHLVSFSSKVRVGQNFVETCCTVPSKGLVLLFNEKLTIVSLFFNGGLTLQIASSLCRVIEDKFLKFKALGIQSF